MKKRYWLKGGIITASVYIVIIIISILITGIDCSSSECFPIYFIFSIPAVFSIILIVNLFDISLETALLHSGLDMSSGPDIKFFILIFIFSILFYFLIGSIVGWIYGKIKSRNHNI